MAFKYALRQEEPADFPALRNIVNPFDVETAKREFEPYRHRIEEMKRDASAFEVVDAGTNDLAVTMMGQARRLSKAISDLKDQKLKPHNEFRTNLISFAKVFSTPLEDVVKTLKGKTEHFAYQEILKQRAREKAEREAAEARQKALDAEAAAAGVETVILPQIPVDQERQVKTRTETGSSLSITLAWQGTVIDDALVPKEYCSPDQKKIDQAIQSGVREIPGVEIKEVPKSRLLA
jgi:hypothetical protein